MNLPKPTKLITGGVYTQWKGNVPYPAYSQPVAVEFFKDVGVNVLMRPYEGVPMLNSDGCVTLDQNGEPVLRKEARFQDREYTLYEIMKIKEAEYAAATGNYKAVQAIDDRQLGKPKQSVESVNMNVSYTDFLESLALQEEPETIDIYSQDPEIATYPTTHPDEFTEFDEFDEFEDFK